MKTRILILLSLLVGIGAESLKMLTTTLIFLFAVLILYWAKWILWQAEREMWDKVWEGEKDD